MLKCTTWFCMYTSQLIWRICHLTPGMDDDYGKSWIRSTRVGLRIQCVMPGRARRGGNPNQGNERGMERLCRTRGVSEKGKQLVVTGFAGDRGQWGRRGREEGWISLWLVMSVWLSDACCTSMECKIKYQFCLTDAHL